MFKINLRQLLRVLFILGLLLPTYLLPSSTTSTPAFAEGGLEETEALEESETLEIEERDDVCLGMEVCIRRIYKPDLGQPMRRRFGLRGYFPKDTLKVTLRNPDGQIVYEESIEHNGRNRMRVDLGKGFEWQEGSYTVTVMLADGLIGDSIDLDVIELDGKLIRKKESALDIEKVKKPAIGEMITSHNIYLIGTFASDPVEIVLRFPNGEVVKGTVINNEENQLVVSLSEIPRDRGVYQLTITSESDDTDTISFGVGAPDHEPNHEPDHELLRRGFGRCW